MHGMKKLLYLLLVIFELVSAGDLDGPQDAKPTETEGEECKLDDSFLPDLGANYFRPMLALNSTLTNNCISGVCALSILDSLAYSLRFLSEPDDVSLFCEYYDNLLSRFSFFDEDACFGDDCQDLCGAVEKIFDESAYEKISKARIQISDRISGIVKFFDLAVGEADILAFKNLRVLVRSCFRSVPSERLETIAFLEIWEIDEVGKPEQIFKGWMFSKHSLNILEHPIYDVRIVD